MAAQGGETLADEAMVPKAPTVVAVGGPASVLQMLELELKKVEVRDGTHGMHFQQDAKSIVTSLLLRSICKC